jgi:diguanylate cyclase (GGDEF)-like protein
VDLFKEINDRWGHQMGDAFLQVLARHWSERLGPHEVLARVGGDEFACLFRRSRPCLLDLRQQLEQDLAAAFPGLPGGVSLGYASFHPRRQAQAAALLALADRRLYREKQQRRQVGRARQGAEDGSKGVP